MKKKNKSFIIRKIFEKIKKKPMEKEEILQKAKIVFLGDTQVGKTSIVIRIQENVFKPEIEVPFFKGFFFRQNNNLIANSRNRFYEPYI